MVSLVSRQAGLHVFAATPPKRGSAEQSFKKPPQTPAPEPQKHISRLQKYNPNLHNYAVKPTETPGRRSKRTSKAGKLTEFFVELQVVHTPEATPAPGGLQLAP